MKIICALVLTCTSAVSALTEDSAEMHRDRLIIRDQFVIETPTGGHPRFHPILLPDSNPGDCR
jgi:hypothetical protein